MKTVIDERHFLAAARRRQPVHDVLGDANVLPGNVARKSQIEARHGALSTEVDSWAINPSHHAPSARANRYMSPIRLTAEDCVGTKWARFGHNKPGMRPGSL